MGSSGDAGRNSASVSKIQQTWSFCFPPTFQAATTGAISDQKGFLAESAGDQLCFHGTDGETESQPPSLPSLETSPRRYSWTETVEGRCSSSSTSSSVLREPPGSLTMLPVLGCGARRGVGGRSSVLALTKWPSPALMHIPLKHTKKANFTSPNHHLFYIWFLKRPRTHI